MFTETLLESGGLHTRTHRGWTTAASLAMQVVVIGALALIPMLSPEALSLVRKPPEIPIFSAPPSTPTEQIVRQTTATPQSTIPFVQSSHSITLSTMHPVGTNDIAAPGPGSLVQLGVAGPPLLLASGPPPVLKPTNPKGPTHLSHADPASLVHYVKPLYPVIAKQSGTQGAVVLHALISKDGNIEALRVISGHPFLTAAALNAVQQWRYRPYILNGEPVEVDTQITVNFILGNNN